MSRLWPTPALRFCLPRVKRRGYGLGNEFLPWARAFLASQVLDARLLAPAFGLNRRGYWWHFGSAPDDWIYNRALERLLPVVEFGEADYLAHGGGDVVEALRSFAAEKHLFERRAYVLSTEGLWGGYHHVQAAREFIRSTLYCSRYAARNLLTVRDRLDGGKIIVGMHMRLGDFAPAGAPKDYRGVSSISLPLEWMCAIARCLDRAFGEHWQPLLLTDGSAEELAPLLRQWRCVTTADLPSPDCSDILALAGADLLVCSSSSFSTLAAFLSDSPYVCYAPSLHLHPEGVYSLGDYEPLRHKPNQPTGIALSHWQREPDPLLPRGIGVDVDGEIPVSVLEAARARAHARSWQADLVRSGISRRLQSPLGATSRQA